MSAMAVAAVLAGDDRERTLETGALLSALSAILHDTIGKFVDVSGRVTERVLDDGRCEDMTLIVALQDFDRLQQEFVALGELIAYSASRVCGGEQDSARNPIANVTLADLKQRLGDRMSTETMLMVEGNTDDVIF